MTTESLSTYKLLILFNLLIEKPYTKAEIIEKFKDSGFNVTKSVISNYFNRFEMSNINIKSELNSNREKIYWIEKENLKLHFTKEEIFAINDIKKLISLQKDYIQIKKLMRLLYKIAKYIEDQENLTEFVEFGYYSTINWGLVKQLEQHCKNKDVIEIEYILPSGINRNFIIHVDSIKTNNWTEKIYLNGIFQGGMRFSHLPIDRIIAIKEVLRKKFRFNLIAQPLTYIVSKKTYKEAPCDERETIIQEENEKVTIKRPIDDELKLIQRLLYFCPDLYYISDEKIKTSLKEKLETLKFNYDNILDR